VPRMTLRGFYRLTRLADLWLVISVVVFAAGWHLTAGAMVVMLCLAGAIAGGIATFRSLPGRCDLCRGAGRLLIRHQERFGNRMVLECPTCGRVINRRRYAIDIGTAT
jgi:hypothetical protein